MEIKCLKCQSCLDLGNCENPTKKTSINDCFCYRGWWDGTDYRGEDFDEWPWNKCENFSERIKDESKKKKGQKLLFKDIPDYTLQDMMKSPVFGCEKENNKNNKK